MEAGNNGPSGGMWTGFELRVVGLQHLATLKIVFGVLAMCFGIPSVTLAAYSQQLLGAFVSGFGIYTGLAFVFAGIFMHLFLYEGSLPNPTRFKCYYITYRIFLGFCQGTAGTLMGFGIWGLVSCVTNAKQCTHSEARIICACGMMMMGLVLIILPIMDYVVGGRMFRMIQARARGETFDMNEKRC